MRFAIPLFKTLKKAWDAANMTQVFPGGYVAGERVVKPKAFPSLSVWPTAETQEIQTAKGNYFAVTVEIGIVSSTFEGCGDEDATEALENATIAITADGPVAMNTKLRLVSILRGPDSARYAEIEPDLYVCFLTFTAKVSQ